MSHESEWYPYSPRGPAVTLRTHFLPFSTDVVWLMGDDALDLDDHFWNLTQCLIQRELVGRNSELGNDTHG